MKIALVSPIEETVPPKLYGGIEWIVFFLAQKLGEKNHQVYLLTTGDSPKLGNYQIVPIFKQAIRRIEPYQNDLKSRETAKFLAAFTAFKFIQENQFDIVHNHASWRFLLFQNLYPKKFITTLHGPMSYFYQNLVFNQYRDSFYISISNNQRKDLPNLNYVKTIYNAIDTDTFAFANYHNQENLLFFARFSPEKGPIEAIKTAIKTKKKLVIACKVDKSDQEYFNQAKELLDNPYIEFHGEIEVDKRIDFYQNAKALIAPINWEEPFGLMFTEAMACGTPVITFARGSVPEIIKDGETGFIVNQSENDIRGDWIVKKTGIEGLAEAVERIYLMSESEYRQMRRACRKHVEDNFTVERMVNEYEKVYEQILSESK
jgi:glycosyltransferase involved in cell wall biosynthesis